LPGWKSVLVPIVALAFPNSADSQAWPSDSGKSYIIPAAEIIVFDALLNAFDRAVLGEGYHTNMESIRRNLKTRWVTENDPFEINQFGHPFQGSIYHGFARSAGLNFWTSLGYTFAGSAMWEIAGETTPPSWNDQIASGIAGAFLGEALFRVGSLILETGPMPLRSGRRLVTAITSFPLAVNRRLFNRFDEVFPSRDAAYYRRIYTGASGTMQTRGTAGLSTQPTEGVFDVSMEYGLPGADDYQYRQPFDYFSLQAMFTTGTGLESILLRGLVAGRDYELGETYRGVWGLYGSYDYIAPQVFRISSTAVSLGTTAEWRPSDAVAVQGTATAGAGFAAVGALTRRDTSDYHYGIAPQALLASRIIFTDRAALDLSAREYFVSNVAGTTGHDNIFRLDAAFTVRLHQQNALAIRYLLSRRDAFFPVAGSHTQLRGTLGVFYTLLGHDRFGSVR
jgi:hypothetical protein